MVILSPSAGFLLVALAALAAVGPALFGGKAARIAGVVLLIASCFLAVSLYPQFKNERARFAQRAKGAPQPVPVRP